jgi:large subunit ribosomal protein L27Ae
MRHYHLLQNHYYRPTINIDKVSAAVGRVCDAIPCTDVVLQLISLPEAQVEAPEGAVPVIDLVHLGKFKLVSGISLSHSASGPLGICQVIASDRSTR